MFIDLQVDLCSLSLSLIPKPEKANFHWRFIFHYQEIFIIYQQFWEKGFHLLLLDFTFIADLKLAETSTFSEFSSIFFCMLLIMVGFLYLQCSFDFEFFLMKYLGLFTRIFTRIFFQKRKDLFSLIVAAVTIFDKYFRRIYHR